MSPFFIQALRHIPPHPQWEARRMADGEIHVLPKHDTREHTHTEQCWCSPENEGDMIVHNSLDDREAFEIGARKPS